MRVTCAHLSRNHVSEKRNSLSESSTSRSEGTVCKSELAGSAMHEAWLNFEDVLLVSFALHFLSRLAFLSSTVRTSTPVLGPALPALTLGVAPAGALSALRSFTVNLNGGLYTTCSLSLSFFAAKLLLLAVAPAITAAELSFLVRLLALRDFEPVSLFNDTGLKNEFHKFFSFFFFMFLMEYQGI